MGTTPGEYHPNQGPQSWDAVIGDLAGRQHGVVALVQLRDLGVPEHIVRVRRKTGRWYALHRGVYAVGHVALTPRSHYLAAVLACGRGALLSHRAAGAIQGLLGGTAVVEVTAARGCKPKPGLLVHRSRLVHPHDAGEVEGIPCTSVARTLVDLADVLSEERLAKAVSQAEVLRVFDLEALEATLARLPGRRGRHRLGRVLAAYRPEPQLLRSEAERRVKELCVRNGLPMPQFNVQVAGYEVDVYWPEAKLAVEFDGAETHHTRYAFHADRRRDRVLAVEGVQTLRVTWPDVENGFAEQVRAIHRRR